MKYGCEFEGIPNSREKFLSFTIIPPVESCPIRIIDSLQFLPVHCPLWWRRRRRSSWISPRRSPSFTTSSYTLDYDEKQINFLLKKNKFPYEWLDLFDKLNMRSWDMPMKTYPNFAWLRTPHVHQYLQLYLICDVMQLTDILVAFMQKIMLTHHIFPWWLWEVHLFLSRRCCSS